MSVWQQQTVEGHVKGKCKDSNSKGTACREQYTESSVSGQGADCGLQ